MSIAAQCPDCCSCPTATVEWDSVSASKSKCGFPEWAGFVSSPPKYYLVLTENGTRLEGADGACDVTVEWASFTTTYNSSACTISYSGSIVVNGDNCGTTNPVRADDTDDGVYYSVLSPSDDCASGFTFGASCTENVTSGTFKTVDDSCSGSVAMTLSSEYTTALLKSNTVAALPSYDDDWNDTAGSFANLSADEVSYAIRESRYRLRFKIPQVGSGKCYRISWVERFILEAGVGVDSVEVYARGRYRPTVTLSAPPTGGVQAYAVAVMSSSGTVSSIRILNPGSGYTSAPTVTVQSATGGGTSSTGWTATLSASGGQVATITGGSAGNYLPTLAFSGGGGTGATATATLDAQGGIATVTLGAAGSGYTSAPNLTITAKVSGAIAADILLHLGTETPRCAVWDGDIPPGYDPDTPSTYPILGDGDGDNPYFELPIPDVDGTTLVANLRAVCDGSACP